MPRGSSNGSTLSLPQLEQLLARRRSEVARLERKRAKLQKRIDAIDVQIRALGGTPGSSGGRGAGRRSGGGSGGGGRARNEKSLVEVIAEVLAKKGEPMKVGAIADAVRATGYRSNSANFRSIVNQQLIKERKRFAQAGRGLYQLKK